MPTLDKSVARQTFRAGLRACHHCACILLGVTFLVIYIWRSSRGSGGCDGNHLVEFVCKEYSEKYTSGSLCHDLCISKELHLHSCYNYKNNVKSYKSGDLVFKVASNLSWRQERIEEGIQSSEFLKLIEELLQHELGYIDATALMNQLVLDFDTNRDGKYVPDEMQRNMPGNKSYNLSSVSSLFLNLITDPQFDMIQSMEMVQMGKRFQQWIHLKPIGPLPRPLFPACIEIPHKHHIHNVQNFLRSSSLAYSFLRYLINLGEAQNMWWVLRQPDFLNFYIFQDSTSIPHLNGTCGGISIWYNLPLTQGSTLYRKTTPWPVSLFTSTAYRWTLPGWIYRARAMLSLVELAEELYDRDGIRYHLCNVNGLSLQHHDSYEVILTEEAMLLSSQQIRNKLSNITCHYVHDCILTPQCQTMCDFSSRQCSGKITRPTLAVVCDIMEDYLLFDAPKVLKITLSRLIHRCQGLSVYTQMLDLVHSILVLDLKNVLWNYIQNKLK